MITARMILFYLVFAVAAAPHIAAEQRPFKIVTSFYPIYILTLNVVKEAEGVSVTNLVRPNSGCLHDYQLSPAEMKAMSDASVLIINGAGMEGFLDKIKEGRKGLPVINSSRGVGLLRNQNGEPNPHVWLSIPNAEKQVSNIASELSVLDPERADLYNRNRERFSAELQELFRWSKASLEGLQGSEVITFHEAFPYFARDFGLKVTAVVEREPGVEISASELASLIRIIKGAKVRAIFTEPQYPARSAETLARETGVKTFKLDPIVTGPLEESAYVDIMRKDIETLKTALKPNP